MSAVNYIDNYPIKEPEGKNFEQSLSCYCKGFLTYEATGACTKFILINFTTELLGVFHRVHEC